MNVCVCECVCVCVCVQTSRSQFCRHRPQISHSTSFTHRQGFRPLFDPSFLPNLAQLRTLKLLQSTLPRFQSPPFRLPRIKPRFYPLLCQFFMKIIIVFNPVCAFVRTVAAAGADFQRRSKGGRGGRMCVPNDFI